MFMQSTSRPFQVVQTYLVILNRVTDTNVMRHKPLKLLENGEVAGECADRSKLIKQMLDCPAQISLEFWIVVRGADECGQHFPVAFGQCTQNLDVPRSQRLIVRFRSCDRL